MREYQVLKEQADQENALQIQSEQERIILGNQLSAGLTDLQLRRVNYVITHEKLYRDKANYLEHSVLMLLDPNDIRKAELTCYVACDDRQQSYDIEKVYEELIQSSEAMEYITTQMDGDSVDISEVVTIDRNGSQAMGGTNSFKVEVFHYKEEDCRKIAQALIAYMGEKQDALSKTLGDHRIEVINQAFTVVADLDILERQREFRKDMDALEDIVVRNKDAFSPEEMLYYQYLLGDGQNEKGESITEADTPGTPMVSKKYILLGMGLAAFVYMLLIVACYVMNTRLRITDQLQEIYGIQQLGTIPAQNESRRLFCFVDKRILRLREGKQRTFSAARALDLATTAVKLVAQKEVDREICLMGCGLQGQSLTVCETIRETLGKDKIQVGIINNVLYDVQAMEKLESVKGVVLVEQAGETRYSEIAAELELLERQNIKVLGGIVVE